MVRRELEFTVNAPINTNIIIQIFGIQGGGKSTIAGSLALKLQKMYKAKGVDANIFLGFSNSEVVSFFPETKPGDIIIRDEGTEESGEESRLKKIALTNLVKAVREFQRNLIFVDPEQDVPSNLCSFSLEATGIIPETQTNEAILYTRHGTPLGLVYVKREKNREFWEYYAKRKQENGNDLMNAAGMKTVNKDSNKMIQDADKVVSVVIERGYMKYIRNIYDIKPFVDIAGIKGSTYYVQKVANLALLNIRAIQEKKKEEKRTLNSRSNTVEGLEEIESVDDETFLDLIIKKLYKYVDNESIQYFTDWIYGESQRWIGKKYGVSQSKVSEKITNLREDGLGYAAEDAFLELLQQKYTNVEHYGGNSPYPDFIVHDIKAVISFKAYIDPKWNLSHALKHIGQAEINYAKQNDYNLILVIYNLADKKFRYFKVNIPIITA